MKHLYQDKSTVSITIAVPMLLQSLEGARLAGLDIERLLRKSGIEPQQLIDEPEKRVPLDQYVLLSRYTAGAMQDEIAGLFEKPMRIGHFRAMALTSVHAKTVGGAFIRSIEFYNLFENSVQYQIEEVGDEIIFTATRIPGHKIGNTYAIESSLTVQHRFMGWLANERIILNRVTLDYPAPSYRHEYHYMFYDAPVEFDQTAITLRFNKHFMSRPIVQNESAVEGYVRRAPMDVYLPVSAGGKVTVEVRNKIIHYVETNNQQPELRDIASAMNLSQQTLRRHLQKEDSSFHVIKAQIRRDFSINLLGNIELSVEEIAYQSGYTEASAFIRAFKSWTGFTPYIFRKGLLS
ncbi:hypothetical protein A9Q99_19295 [Gammaproteobacteria bacterium 45_16_T64]|nr:hypothetical protein A9Q99_19295 [Gammaproteobacteria bacterium 45_16_T64]